MLEVRGRHTAVLRYKKPLPQRVFSTLGLFSNSEGRYILTSNKFWGKKGETFIISFHTLPQFQFQF